MKRIFAWYFVLGWLNCYSIGMAVTGHWYPWS